MDFRREISDIDLLGRMVLDNLPHLDNLTIGRGMSKLEGQARDGKLVWPWTGRVRKYLLECFPRYQGRDGEEDEDPNGPLFDQPGQDEDNLPSSAYSLASFPSRELF
jgi:hypothetical protein